MQSEPTIPVLNRPVLGETVVMPIVSAATRTTLFPEVTPLVSVGPDAIEIVLLRNEVVFTSQQGTVTGHDGLGHASVEMTLGQPAMQMLDLGHIRLNVATASDLGVAILRHMIEHHGADIDVLIGRLQAA